MLRLVTRILDPKSPPPGEAFQVQQFLTLSLLEAQDCTPLLHTCPQDGNKD